MVIANLRAVKERKKYEIEYLGLLSICNIQKIALLSITEILNILLRTNDKQHMKAVRRNIL